MGRISGRGKTSYFRVAGTLLGRRIPRAPLPPTCLSLVNKYGPARVSNAKRQGLFFGRSFNSPSYFKDLRFKGLVAAGPERFQQILKRNRLLGHQGSDCPV